MQTNNETTYTVHLTEMQRQAVTRALILFVQQTVGSSEITAEEWETADALLVQLDPATAALRSAT